VITAAASGPPPTLPPVDLSVVVPVYDEEGAAAGLAREIAAAFAGWRHEILFVNDASRDATLQALQAVQAGLPQLRVLSHAANAGQSRAIRTGVLAARGAVILTLDGDGQNDPADGPRLVESLLTGGADLAMVAGRRARRQDSRAKRLGSRFANGMRRRLLQDGADDTGCGLKAIRREAYLRLPYFDHMHRFIPALLLREGYRIAFADVGHRPRTTGRSKYSNFGRLRASVADLAGVLWLRARSRSPGAVREL
jgi:dolichol-phosphate mannosyltransferase